jgi:hypothetical protein
VVSADIAHHLQHQPVVIHRIGVVARRGGVLLVIAVAILQDSNDLAQVDLFQVALQIKIVGKEIICHALSPQPLRRLVCLFQAKGAFV